MVIRATATAGPNCFGDVSCVSRYIVAVSVPKRPPNKLASIAVFTASSDDLISESPSEEPSLVIEDLLKASLIPLKKLLTCQMRQATIP